METILGVRAWIFFYFIGSFFGCSGIILYYFREWIKKQYYSVAFPEKLIKIIVHYDSNLFNVYWRLIPDSKILDKIEGKKYHFDIKRLIKPNKLYAIESGKKHKFKIDDKTYTYEEKAEKRFSRFMYPEIHYFFNNPNPIIYEDKKDKIEISSYDLNELTDADLFGKLLRLAQEERLLMIILIIVILILILCAVSVFGVGKLVGWWAQAKGAA